MLLSNPSQVRKPSPKERDRPLCWVFRAPSFDFMSPQCEDKKSTWTSQVEARGRNVCHILSLGKGHATDFYWEGVCKLALKEMKVNAGSYELVSFGIYYFRVKTKCQACSFSYTVAPDRLDSRVSYLLDSSRYSVWGKNHSKGLGNDPNLQKKWINSKIKIAAK